MSISAFIYKSAIACVCSAGIMSGIYYYPTAFNDKQETKTNIKQNCFSLYKNSPLRVIVKHKDRSTSQGSAFWINSKYGNNIFITNAHVVKTNSKNHSVKYVKNVYIKDINGKRLKAKVIAVKEIRNSFINSQTGIISSIKIADIAILESKKRISSKFEAVKYNLSFSPTDDVISLRGFSAKDKLQNKCLKSAYEGDVIHLYSNNSWAVNGLSGSPTINAKDEVIGIITTTGIVINHKTKKKEAIFIVPSKERKSISILSSKNIHLISWPLYATLTSAKEIQLFLDETYSANNKSPH